MFSNKQEISDVLIIGGGVIGMSLARELKKRGAGKVTLLERGKLGQEASFAAAGMLSPQSGAEKRTPFFDFCCAGRALYENFAAELREETGTCVNLETSGTLCISFSDEESERLDGIYGWQKAAGFEVEKLSREDILALEPGIDPGLRGGSFFPRDAQVDNRLLVGALAGSIKTYGVTVFENIAVDKVLMENGGASGVETASGNFRAPVVVLATGAWTSFIKYGGNIAPLVEVAPVRGQMLSFLSPEKLFTRVIHSGDGYLVPRAGNRILVGATVENAGFAKEVTEEGVEYLLKCAYAISPRLKGLEISEKWSGLRPRAADERPILGKYRDINGLYIATAHFRDGILLAPLTADILAEQILEGKTSKYLETFSPNRFINAVSA